MSSGYFDWETAYGQYHNRFPGYKKQPVIGITGNFGEKGCELAEGYFESVLKAGATPVIIPPFEDRDALANVLSTVNEILKRRGEVITVCGAGGNRVKGKRPIMAQEAVKNSDRVIITSDNPRFEEPQEIINDMLAGLDKEQMRKVISIVDRKEAIRTACMMARPGDVVLVAGKGHEDYQEVKGVKHHFDDHEVIKGVFGI